VRLRAAAIGLAALLAGCAVAPERPPVGDPQAVWQARQIALAALQTWEVSGKLGMRSSEKSGTASVVWVRRDDNHRINLFGPFGAGHVILTEDAGGATLQDAKKKTYTAPDAHRLLLETTGWDVPFDKLQYWVAGIPAPDSRADTSLDEWGRLSRLVQDGWDVQFQEYTSAGALELPARLLIERSSASPAADRGVEVRLVIKRWGLEI
jgi:outer membrane lipoprotein LolB